MLRRMKLEVSLKIKEEVHKQFNVGFFGSSKIPLKVANMVPVQKG